MKIYLKNKNGHSYPFLCGKAFSLASSSARYLSRLIGTCCLRICTEILYISRLNLSRKCIMPPHIALFYKAQYVCEFMHITSKFLLVYALLFKRFTENCCAVLRRKIVPIWICFRVYRGTKRINARV